MGKVKSKQASLVLWAALAALLSQNLVIPVMCTATFEEQKTYYSPDPNIRSPPTGSHTPPSGGSYGTPSTPSHGTPSHGTPSHGTPSHGTPSHGSGGHGKTPPANCGNPPSGGHHHDPTPSPPSGGHGGGYNPSPPTYGGSPPTYGGSPPSTPTPSTPSTPTIVIPPVTPTPDTPSTPTIVSPPTTPIIDPGTPSTPGISTPPFDPNTPPFTCDYWRTHPGLIWGLFGWWGTVGGALGVASVPGFGSTLNLPQALSNTRTDGLGELYRQGTASLLNSMVSKRFAYTTQQVRDNFVTALSSDKAAAAQAQLFKLANEGRLGHRA